MEKALQFLAHYNPQIIQTGFAIVFLLIIVYVYRLFFMPSESEPGTSEVMHSPAIEQKLNQLLEQQKTKSNAGPLFGTEQTPRTSAVDEEIDKLKAEIYNLRVQVSESEKKLAEAAAAALAAAPLVAGDGTESSPVAGDNPELLEKIRTLESRLVEYEIIADDIAELSQLRSDNQRMKQELEKLGATPPASEVAESAEPATEEPVDLEAEMASAIAAQRAGVLDSEATDAIVETAPKVAEPAAETGPTSVANPGISDGQAEIDALFAQAQQDIESASGSSEPTSTETSTAAGDPQADVSSEEQDLLNEFEKVLQKKGEG